MTAEHLHAVVHEGRGPFALLVHGAVASRSYWADNIDALSEVCRPVVVELWGHGRSPSPADPARHEPDGYVAEFEHLRAELGADEWITIGQSMGAALTLHYGLAHPERVIVQVITNCSSAFSPADSWRQRHRTIIAPLVERLRAEGTDVLREHFINPSRSNRIPKSTRDLLAIEFDEHDAIGMAQSLLTTNALVPLGDRVLGVSRPTILTLGVDDERFSSLVPQAKLIPGLEIVELDAGHAVNAHDPNGWNQAVIEFITRSR
ncbi:MAG: alpha/beta fold hydrolase [Actinomycetia bacterium]|nr:alpha/beta fold hydrolase [Actinomycetes bacterium]